MESYGNIKRLNEKRKIIFTLMIVRLDKDRKNICTLTIIYFTSEDIKYLLNTINPLAVLPYFCYSDLTLKH